MQQVADAAGAAWKVDERGNIVVYAPARGADPGASTVAVQAHLDMVCDKQPDVVHDFAKDPIRPWRDGDRVFASGTTLGADNGIGVAAALALLDEPDLRHGPIELLFTVEEETGLKGALALDPSLIRARLLINLDSEDPDELTIGCAGAGGVVIRFSPTTETMSDGWIGREVAVSGLKGGHSGLQIHKRLANAIKLLTDALFEVQDAGVNFRLGSIKGGSAHNVIPHAAIAQLSIVPDMAKALETVMDRVSATLRTEWGKDEHDLALEVRQIPAPKQVMADQSRDLLLRLLEDLPHGVLAMSKSFPGKVETSSNLAYIQMRDGEVEIMTSSRSFIDAELRKVQSRILSLGEAIGAEVEVQEGYPGWEPNPSSWLLKLTEKIYQQVYGRLPEIRVTHGGLECGVIVSKLPGMEAISFGPLIRGGHTSEEHVYASTVPHTWKLLTALLEALCSY